MPKKVVGRKSYSKKVNGKIIHVPQGTTTVHTNEIKKNEVPQGSLHSLLADTPDEITLPASHPAPHSGGGDTLAPQANSLPQLAATVDAVALGIDTRDEIAEALGGYHPRQGDYYANAAEALGLIYSLDNTSPRIWVLTEAGQQFSVASAEARAELLEEGLVNNYWINLHVDGEEALRRGLIADGYSGDTLQRRIDCVKNWSSFLFELDLDEKSILIGDAQQAVINWSSSNSERITQIHTSRRRKAPSPIKTRSCPNCFSLLAATEIECSCGVNVPI